MPTGRSKQESTRRDANDARKNRRKAGKRRRGKAVAAHCTRCNQRPAEPGPDDVRPLLPPAVLRRPGLPPARRPGRRVVRSLQPRRFRIGAPR